MGLFVPVHRYLSPPMMGCRSLEDPCSRLCRRRGRNSDRLRLWDHFDNPVHLSQSGVPLISCVVIPCTSVPLEVHMMFRVRRVEIGKLMVT